LLAARDEDPEFESPVGDSTLIAEFAGRVAVLFNACAFVNFSLLRETV